MAWTSQETRQGLMGDEDNKGGLGHPRGRIERGLAVH